MDNLMISDGTNRTCVNHELLLLQGVKVDVVNPFLHSTGNCTVFDPQRYLYSETPTPTPGTYGSPPVALGKSRTVSLFPGSLLVASPTAVCSLITSVTLSFFSSALSFRFILFFIFYFFLFQFNYVPQLWVTTDSHLSWPPFIPHIIYQIQHFC